jgi:hypothetical protein
MKRRLPPPDAGLKAPVTPFSETFSAETVIMQTFFKNLTGSQERLGPEFEKVLSDNAWDLYAKGDK